MLHTDHQTFINFFVAQTFLNIISKMCFRMKPKAITQIIIDNLSAA